MMVGSLSTVVRVLHGSGHNNWSSGGHMAQEETIRFLPWNFEIWCQGDEQSFLLNTVRAGGGLTVFYIKTGARTSKEERGESDSILRPSFQILDPAVPGADALGSMRCCRLFVPQLYLTLYNPMDYSPPGSSLYGIFQAGVLEWVAISLSRGSSQPSDWTHASYIVGGFFTAELPGKLHLRHRTQRISFFS